MVIGCGLVGCETAVHLATDGRQVTVLEIREDVCMDCGRMHCMALMYELESRKNITIRCDTVCQEITSKGVKTEDGRFFACDTVIMAADLVFKTAAVDVLRLPCREFYCIGDGNKPGLMYATRGAHGTVLSLGL